MLTEFAKGIAQFSDFFCFSAVLRFLIRSSLAFSAARCFFSQFFSKSESAFARAASFF